MSALDWVGAAAGAVGAAGGVGAVIVAIRANGKAKAANAIALKANELSSDSNRIAEEANHVAKEALGVSKQSLSHEQQLAMEARTAKITHKYGESGVIPWSRTAAETGTLGMRLYNEGPDVARDIQLSIRKPNGNIVSGSVYTLLEPNKEIAPSVPISPSDFEGSESRDFGFTVTWRDGNGTHQMDIPIRVTGEWMSAWRSEIISPD